MMKFISFVFAAAFVFICTCANSATLTQTQLNTIKHDAAIAAMNSEDAASYYNTIASPATYAWITSCTAQSLDEGADYSSFDSLVAGKRDAWNMFLSYAPRDMSKARNRKVVTDVWGAATASSIAESVLNASTRKINNIEKLLGGTTTATTGTVTAIKLNFEGTVTGNDILNAREFGI